VGEAAVNPELGDILVGDPQDRTTLRRQGLALHKLSEFDDLSALLVKNAAHLHHGRQRSLSTLALEALGARLASSYLRRGENGRWRLAVRLGAGCYERS
jgi:hypothetical protein